MNSSPRFRSSLLLAGLLLAGAALMLSGCDGGATAGVGSSLSFVATGGTGSSGFSTRLATTGEGVVVDQFRMGVHEIELEEDMDVEIDSGVEFEGTFLVDILADTITNTMGGTMDSLIGVLPAGSYQELEFELTPVADVESGNSTPLALYAAGSYVSTANGNEARTYTLTVSTPMKIEVEGPNAIVLDGATNDLLVVFRLDELLSEANLDALIADGTLTTALGGGAYAILIDSVTDVETVDPLFKDALEFGEDHNGDHDLDLDEDVGDDIPG